MKKQLIVFALLLFVSMLFTACVFQEPTMLGLQHQVGELSSLRGASFDAVNMAFDVALTTAETVKPINTDEKIQYITSVVDLLVLAQEWHESDSRIDDFSARACWCLNQVDLNGDYLYLWSQHCQ